LTTGSGSGSRFNIIRITIRRRRRRSLQEGPGEEKKKFLAAIMCVCDWGFKIFRAGNPFAVHAL
jgi:hypothetical protein